MKSSQMHNGIDEATTLHAVMRDAIRDDLRSQYRPENEIPHKLVVLLMQMNEDNRGSQIAR
jgi:hypothetical protein